ncbi:hypothetical protein Tco_1432817, partial [Tanacetum coccineum]
PEQAPLSPDYVPEPEYPEYLVPSDAEAHIEDQPLPYDASPTALSPGYIADSDLEENPEKYPSNYPADRGDDDDDESSDDDDDDDDDDVEEDEEDDEEEEHLALADSSVVPTEDPVSSAEDTKAFDTDESAPTLYAFAPTPPSPPPSPLTPLSSPLAQIPSPPLPLPSPPTTSPTYVEVPLGNRAAEIRLRAALPSTHHPSEIPLPPLLLPTTTHRDDLLEANMPLWKRARFTTPTYRFKVGESSSAAAARQAGQTLAHRVDYGFIDTMEASIHASESRVMTVMRVVNWRVTNLATTQRQETHELQVRCEDTQYDRALLGAQAMEAQIRALQRDVDVLQRQRIGDEDRLIAYIQHEHDRFRDLVRVAEAGPQDGPEDVGSYC